ncbi:LOW QUALITY PROTEIN: hypothetical protein V2J09_009404 [Rumex salicifolius]
MITWPLYVEQKMNVVMLSEDLRVGLRPELGPNRVVHRDEVSRIVRELMAADEEGKRMSSRMEELKVATLTVMSPDHGSSSTKALNEIARIWKTKLERGEWGAHDHVAALRRAKDERCDAERGPEPELGPNRFVRRDEVSRIVRELMAANEEEKRMSSRMEELKVAASTAMSLDHGSSSTKALNEIARIWKNKFKTKLVKASCPDCKYIFILL